MQVSKEWLNEFIDLSDISDEQIVHELTMSGLEVEEVEITKPKFSNIRVAKILEIDNHPNADKLHLVKVDIGTETKTVVCGAQNIEVGQIIPYASVGSKVLSRKTGEMFELTPAVIRGVESQGMLCSQDELGLEGMQKEDGILVLNRIYDNLKLGEPLEKVLNIVEDTIFHVAPTANRGDQMSIIGVARELSAIFNKKMRFSYIQTDKDLAMKDFEVEIIDNDCALYYSIAVLKDIKIKPSPDWMQRRLLASGIRAINNVVDITNYVLMEYGLPLHSFDFDKLNGYLCVRRANDGETLVTLDEIERKLSTDTVLIATKEQGVCAAGVFGGANSGVDDNTKNIALEAAYFTPRTNRVSARSIGYRSDASARFERGVDIEAVKPALLRAIQLLIDYADAKLEGVVETGSNKAPNIEITLRFAQVKRILGIEIEPTRCIEILDKLGFELLGKNELAAKFKVPSFRVNDVTREIDLIEEIARINGYDKIEVTLPKKTVAPEFSLETQLISDIKNLFLGCGFYEAVNSSLIGEPLLKEFSLTYDKEKAVKVTNPQSEDHTMLRQTLIPNILTNTKYNISNGQKNVWLFEIGKKYLIEEPASRDYSGVKETRMLSGVMTGELNNKKWGAQKTIDFYSIKGVIENLFDMLGLSQRLVLEPVCDVSYLHPGKSAAVKILGKNRNPIGYFGELHPILKGNMKLQQNVYLFELDLDEILANVNIQTVRYKKLPQFPEVQRDIAFIVPQEVSCADLVKTIKKAADNTLFIGSELFDVYQGSNIEEGFKSVAFRVKFQDTTQTLTDEIVDGQVNKIKDALKKSNDKILLRE